MGVITARPLSERSRIRWQASAARSSAKCSTCAWMRPVRASSRTSASSIARPQQGWVMLGFERQRPERQWQCPAGDADDHDRAAARTPSPRPAPSWHRCPRSRGPAGSRGRRASCARRRAVASPGGSEREPLAWPTRSEFVLGGRVRLLWRRRSHPGGKQAPADAPVPLRDCSVVDAGACCARVGDVWRLHAVAVRRLRSAKQ